MEPFANQDLADTDLQVFLNEAATCLCEWLSGAEEGYPLPFSVDLPAVPPELEGVSNAQLIDDLRLIMAGSYQPSHPGSLAHLDPPPLTSSIVADLICAGINNNLLAEELSPSLTLLERKIIQWFVEKLGFKEGAGGVAASGGTLSNLMALVISRKQAGLENDPEAVLFVSEDSHVSIDKSVRIMGLAPDSLRKIPTNEKGEMNLEILERDFINMKEKGRNCFAIVATAGTTVRGAIDPLIPISDFCKNEGIWLHVDAAIGGAYALSKSNKFILNGIANCNSVTLNPQKILGIAKTCSILLVSNSIDLEYTFSTGIPYVEPPLGSELHGGEIGLQGSRSGEVLKLWMGLRQLGEKGINSLLEKAIMKKEFLLEKLDQSKLDVLTGPLHLIACTPKNITPAKSLNWAISTRDKLLKQKFMLSRPKYKNLYYLKAVLGNPYTKFSHLDRLAKILNESVSLYK